MPMIEELKKMIEKELQRCNDADLLDLVYKLLIAEC
jgi:hypothetical protein